MRDDREEAFDVALKNYLLAKSGQSIDQVDDALDALMAVPSPSIGAFGEKIGILECEYGDQAQPRHIRAIYRDIGRMRSSRLMKPPVA
jgi:hypothetical protein